MPLEWISQALQLWSSGALTSIDSDIMARVTNNLKDKYQYLALHRHLKALIFLFIVLDVANALAIISNFHMLKCQPFIFLTPLSKVVFC